MSDPMQFADVSIMRAGGRDLRVAHWRLNQPSDRFPVLFFNGIGASLEIVAPLAEALSNRAFITFDMPGIGESPEPIVPYTPQTMAWTAARLLDRLGISQVDIMGFSWGGVIAQQLALQYGARVRRVILAGTTAGLLAVPGSPLALARLGDAPRLAGRGEGGRIAARIVPPTIRGYAYQLMAMAGWTSAAALPFLKKPVLIMAGECDDVVPLANAHILKGLIPEAKMEIFADGGHLFLATHREQAQAAIRTFLDAPDMEGDV